MFRIPGRTNVLSLVLRLALSAAVSVCALHAGPAWAGVIYVKANAAGANNGLSWTDAYTDLQAGLAAAVWGDEIWVAQGTYKPTSGTDRTVSFQLKTLVGLYGGFLGVETARTQRNWTANPTVLSGDIGTPGSASDNTYRVVVGANVAVLDGFTITAGNANATNAFDNGGGMYNSGHSPTVTNCTFSENTASHGGGMFNDVSSPIVTNCTFSGNKASNAGGGMYNLNSSPTVTTCTFSGNTAQGIGGGMYNNGSSPTVTNCTFSGNIANGGGGMYSENCSPTVANCIFSGNMANDGGGMYNYGSPTVTNCIFWDNTAPLGAEIYKQSGTPTFSHCDIKGSGGSGALWNPALGADGGGNIMGDPRLVAPATPAGPDGLWRTTDDGLRLQSDSPCIGAADPAVAPQKDILGLFRDSASDIGAYEFSWTLTYSAGAGGSITGTTPQTVAYGASGSQVTAVPNVGYHFVQWSDGVLTASRTDTNLTSHITVTAMFALNTSTLTYTAGVGGSISALVTAVPSQGCRFVQWSDRSTANPRADNSVTAGVTVMAIFAATGSAAVVKDWSLYE